MEKRNQGRLLGWLAVLAVAAVMAWRTVPTSPPTDGSSSPASADPVPPSNGAPAPAVAVSSPPRQHYTALSADSVTLDNVRFVDLVVFHMISARPQENAKADRLCSQAQDKLMQAMDLYDKPGGRQRAERLESQAHRLWDEAVRCSSELDQQFAPGWNDCFHELEEQESEAGQDDEPPDPSYP